MGFDEDGVLLQTRDPAVKALVQAAKDAVWTLDTIAISRGSYLDSVRRGLREALAKLEGAPPSGPEK